MSEETNSRPKKILFVSPNIIAGGAQRQLINVANGFHRKGYKISVFLFNEKGELRDFLDERIKVFSPCYMPVVKNMRLFRDIHGTISLIRTIMIEKPDILYCRQWPKMPIAIIGKMLKIKTVSVEGNNLEQTLLLRKRLLLFSMRRTCAQLSDVVVANSQSLAREVKDVFRLDSDVEVIYNGIDIENIREKSQEKKIHKWFKGEVPVILSVGSLKDDQKGFSHLLEALEIVNRTKEAHLIIMGDGQKEKLRNLSQKLSIADKTDFLGATSNPFPYILKADILACASLYEGLSNVLLEAIALGKPVISTDHKHGANEIIEDYKSGLLVPVGSPKSMAEAIIKILDDKKLRQSLGEKAKERAYNFSRDKMISRYEKLFSKM